MVSKLIALPLAILVIVAVLSMTGLGATDLGTLRIGQIGMGNDYLYDYLGNPMVHSGNLTGVQAEGWFQIGDQYSDEGQYMGENPAIWLNGSRWQLTQTAYYAFYNPTDYADGNPAVQYTDIHAVKQSNWTGGIYNVNSSLGFIALIVGLMALALVVGLRVLGSGTSNSMVFVMGTAYLALWGVFSVLAVTLITSLSTFGAIIYFILTLIYTMGIISSFQGGSDD